MAAGVVFLWGGSQGILTRQAGAGFGDVSQGNRHVITVQWVAEGPGSVLGAALMAAAA